MGRADQVRFPGEARVLHRGEKEAIVCQTGKGAHTMTVTGEKIGIATVIVIVVTTAGGGRRITMTETKNGGIIRIGTKTGMWKEITTGIVTTVTKVEKGRERENSTINAIAQGSVIDGTAETIDEAVDDASHLLCLIVL